MRDEYGRLREELTQTGIDLSGVRRCPFCGVAVWSLPRHLTARLRGWIYHRLGVNLGYSYDRHMWDRALDDPHLVADIAVGQAEVAGGHTVRWEKVRGTTSCNVDHGGAPCSWENA